MPNGKRNDKKIDGGDRRDQEWRQVGDEAPDQHSGTHFGHEGHGHSTYDRRSTISRCQDTRCVKQFVAGDFGNEYGCICRDENCEQRTLTVSEKRSNSARGVALSFSPNPYRESFIR
jgi:hypothetical protein